MGTFRLFLAYLVIVGHTNGFARYSSMDPGTIAIAVFFFISGYLMPLAFNRNYQFPTFAQRARHYVVNRILRIFPLYWLSLFLVISHGLISGTNGVVADALEHPIIFVQNILLLGLNQEHLWGLYERFNNPSWTLDVELQYYAVVPLLAWGWMRYKRLTFTAMLCLSAVSAYLLTTPTLLVDIDRSLVAYGVLFFAGFLCYSTARLRAMLASSMTPTIGAAGAITSFLFFGQVQTVVLTTGLILIAGRLLVAQEADAFAKVDRTLGDLSYPVYIFHDFVIGVTQRRVSALFTHEFDLSGNWLLLFNIGSNVLLVTIAAFVIMKTIEMPIERLREVFKRKAPAHQEWDEDLAFAGSGASKMLSAFEKDPVPIK
jgi:peptidoglycan/LPS O-acetylase OafA/YrhL